MSLYTYSCIKEDVFYTLSAYSTIETCRLCRAAWCWSSFSSPTVVIVIVLMLIAYFHLTLRCLYCNLSYEGTILANDEIESIIVLQRESMYHVPKGYNGLILRCRPSITTARCTLSSSTSARRELSNLGNSAKIKIRISSITTSRAHLTAFKSYQHLQIRSIRTVFRSTSGIRNTLQNWNQKFDRDDSYWSLYLILGKNALYISF